MVQRLPVELAGVQPEMVGMVLERDIVPLSDPLHRFTLDAGQSEETAFPGPDEYPGRISQTQTSTASLSGNYHFGTYAGPQRVRVAAVGIVEFYPQSFWIRNQNEFLVSCQ